MNSKKSAAMDLVRLCCQVLDAKKAGELAVLDVSHQSSITDYLVIATATSEPHLKALRQELEKAIDSNEIHLVGAETAPESGWMVIDAFDVMVHLFLADAREKYGLERLWRDATQIPISKILAAPAKRGAAKRVSDRTGPKPQAAKRRRRR
jgi:ribosome-associated protein